MELAEVSYYFPPGKMNYQVYFIFLLSTLHYENKNSETTKASNLKFGQIMSLYMSLRPSNFGGATSRGLGQMHSKLVTAMFMK